MLDIERFSLRTYEYHETNQSIRDGFIFGLFSMKNASRDALINELDNPESLMDLKESCLEELKTLKIKKNIGQIIESVGNFSDDGFTVRYKDGDVCDHESGTRFTSQINYVCNNSTKDIGWPVLSHVENKCHFVFQWESYYACPQCKESQTKTVKSSCEKNGQRTFINIPMDKCVVDFSESGDYLQVYEYPLTTEVANLNKHVFRTQYQMPCQPHDEFFDNPML